MRRNIHSIKNAKDIVNRLAIIFRIAQTYSVENQAVVRAIDAFAEIAGHALQHEGSLNIELLGEYFYLNEARVRYSFQYYLNFDYLTGEFRRRGLGRIMFSGSISREDIQAFVRVFLSCVSEESPYVVLKGLAALIESIDIGPLKQADGDKLLDRRRIVKKTYFNAVTHLRNVVGKVQEGEKIEIRKARHVVNTLIDHMLEEEQMLISMTAIKDYDDYTYYHSVNVSILSIALGMKLGLNKKRLSELGIAAFLHDIGKVEVPNEVLNKPTSFTEEDWELIRRHPSDGVRTILNSMRLDPTTIKSAIVAFEHHLNYDGSGYPAVPRPYTLDLYSNIVTIADRFDAMTSARVYSRVAMSPEEALRELVEKAGTHVDPLLLKVWIRLVGVFPIGTLVVLDTNELGVVYRGNPDSPERPVIVLLVDQWGKKVEGMFIDLSAKDREGKYPRSVKKTLDHNKYGLNLSDYLLETY